jgi:hypothetical protein
MIVLDAFSSDAVPVHLLTREAFEIYKRHLNTNGIIAVHISNHYLNLQPVIVNVARHFRLNMGFLEETGDRDEGEWWVYDSTWAIMSPAREMVDRPEMHAASIPIDTNSPSPPLWTDDYSSLYSILK